MFRNVVTYLFGQASLSSSSYTKRPGAGAKRADERHAAKLKSNEAIPAVDVMTRQRRRAEQRKRIKATRPGLAEQARLRFENRHEASV